MSPEDEIAWLEEMAEHARAEAERYNKKARWTACFTIIWSALWAVWCLYWISVGDAVWIYVILLVLQVSMCLIAVRQYRATRHKHPERERRSQR